MKVVKLTESQVGRDVQAASHHHLEGDRRNYTVCQLIIDVHVSSFLVNMMDACQRKATLFSVYPIQFVLVKHQDSRCACMYVLLHACHATSHVTDAAAGIARTAYPYEAANRVRVCRCCDRDGIVVALGISVQKLDLLPRL